METILELSVFFQSVFIGFVGGIIYEIFSVLRWVFGVKKGKMFALGVVFDVVFFAIFAFFTTISSTFAGFPAFRWYIAVGYGIGFLLYLKILHRILDFLEKVCYNAIYKSIKTCKSKLKKQKKFERKQGKLKYERK